MITESKEFFEVIKERLRNPFYGHFIFFWILINWRPLFIILDFKTSIIDRITLIDENFVSVFYNLLIPFALAVVSYIGQNYLMLYIDRFASDGKRKRKDDFFKNLAKDFEGKTKVAEAQYKYEEAKQNYKNLKALNDQISELKNQVAQLAESNKKLSGDLESAKEGLTFQKIMDKQEDLNRELEEIFYKSGMQEVEREYLQNIKILEYQSYIENLNNYFFNPSEENPSTLLIDFCKKHNLIIDAKDKSKPFELTLKGYFILQKYIKQKTEERYSSKK